MPHVCFDDGENRAFSLGSDSSFLRMEHLCEQMSEISVQTPPHPRILLNNIPFDMMLNKTLLSKSNVEVEQTIDVPVKTSSRNLCDTFNDSFCASKMAANISAASSHDNTSSSAYFSIQSSTINWKSQNESTEINRLPKSVMNSDTSGYQSEQMSEELSYKISDTLDVCNYRRQQWSPYVTPKFIDEPSTLASSDKTPSKLLDDVSLVSMHSNEFATSSPIQSNGSGASCMANDDRYIEPDDLNDTLERVNYRLAVCGYKSPSPTKMAKRRQLMREYVDELLKNEFESKNSQPINKDLVSCGNMPFGALAPNPSTEQMAYPSEQIERELDALTSSTPYNDAKRAQLLEELAKLRKVQTMRKAPKRTITLDKFPFE